MTHVPHELAADFPENAGANHALKEANRHFARLMEEYPAINRNLHRAEINVEPMSNETEVKLRNRRALLKDELYQMLTAEA